MTTAIMVLGKSGTRWHEISSMQMLGGARWSRVIPMEAYRRRDRFFVHFDLPGARPQ
jgi:hypothetical protein